MSVKQLLEEWEQERAERDSARQYPVALPMREASRIEALAEMYGRTPGSIVCDLVRLAMQDLERQLPYVQGERVIAEDEFGDPVYEDIGPMPKFMELTSKHQLALSKEEQGS